MKNPKTNIVITDDHNLFRKGICSLISDFDFIENIYECSNGKELLELLNSLENIPEVVLLDLQMPVMDGIEVTPKLRKLYPELKIIILTMEDDEQFILHMINEGVNGYLLKNADPEELENALLNVIAKDYYFSDDISSLVVKNLRSHTKTDFAIVSELTEREIEVLEFICKEYTASEIAEKMILSARTIEGYKRKLLEKTGAKNMAGLVVFAIKNKLVEL